jgi:molybdopterin molybdotransferase
MAAPPRIHQMSLSLAQARAIVIDVVRPLAAPATTETVPLADAAGRVLAEDVRADRDQPPFDRSTRDGFAVRASDVAGAGDGAVTLAVAGEVPAGASFAGSVSPGTCVEIMTGAPVPAGADAVLMIEHTERRPAGEVVCKRAVVAGENIVPRGSELASGALAFAAGRRLDPAAIGLLASLGRAHPAVWPRPRVAVLATGDELCSIEEQPAPAQIRDSNRHTLSAQILRAGGLPVLMPIARDRPDVLAGLMERAVAACDILLVTGGVSAGKYDFVEQVLAKLGGRVSFDSVDIRPGKPLVFGVLGGRPFFGLPGNPLSTYVTFELFVRPALDLLAGLAQPQPLRFSAGRLEQDYSQRALSLTVFLPASVAGSEGVALPLVRPMRSQGSGDLGALAAADALLVIEPGTTALPAGTLVPLLAK